MMVKVCGITRRQDAEVASAAGASAIGFIFYPQSPRYITPARAAELGRGLFVWKVGIFVNETVASVEAVMRAAQLDVAQLYGGEAPANARVWRAYRLPLAPGSIDAAGAEAVLLDGPSNGVSFDWNQARGMGKKIIVAGGLDASNVAQAIRLAQPWGVDASSRLETAPGIKDHDKVRQFVMAAQAAAKAA